MNLLPPLPLKDEFSLYQKYWDLLDYREKVDKSDIKKFSLESIMYKGCFPNEILVGRKLWGAINGSNILKLKLVENLFLKL